MSTKKSDLSKSVYGPAPTEGPGGQQRLFQPGPTKWQERAATERVPDRGRSWEDIRETPTSPGRGVSHQSVHETLGEHGVTTRGARTRLRKTWDRAVASAPAGGMPRGQDFYAREQAGRFEQDAKHFNLPYHVVVAANAIMSPKTSLATPHGYQTNREAAFRVIQHAQMGKSGVPDTGGRGLRANAAKAADLVRQHLEHGTHPLDATNAAGKPLLSGPKVQAYYSNYMNPSRTTTDIQHSKIMFGDTVRSGLSDEEKAHKKTLDETYGKGSKESGAYIPKSPAEELLEKSGVHEWSAHNTEHVAAEVGTTPGELQSVVWHQKKTELGGTSRPQEEVQPLFAPRTKPKSQGRQGQLFSDRRYRES